MRYLALVILLGLSASLFGQNNSIALSQMKYSPAPNYAIITTTSGRQIYIEKDSFDIDTRLTAGWHSNDTLYLQVSRVSGQLPGPIDTIAVYIPAGGGGATYINAGSGISVTGSGTLANPFVITNTAPDQTVSLTGGTAIGVTGTYPNFTINNTAPDVTVAITGAGINAVSGTYPNFTITGTEVDGSITNEGRLGVGAGGANTATITTNTSGSNAVTISGGTGIGISESTSTNGGTITITNSSPDQTVSITGSTGITVGGSYPNFSLTVADQSATNELQTLSISNDTLTISSGNSVALPKRYNYINGLTLASDTVKLGGNLTANTDIGGNFYLRRDASLNSNALMILNNTGTTSTGLQATGTSTGVSSTGTTRGVLSNSGTWPIVANNTSTSNSVTTGLRMTREATFTSAIGHGIRLEYAGRSSTGATVNIASIDAVATRVTQDSMSGRFDFTNRNNGTNQTNMQIFSSGALKYNNYGAGTFTGTAAKWLAVTSSGDVIEMNDPTGGGGVDTATFLQQDSILIYSVAGVEFGRDTIRTAGAGGDDWGSQVVISDTTLVGNGTAGNPLGVDTTQIATHYYISEGFTTKYIDFDTLYANNYAEGRMKWNVDENSVEIGLSPNLSGTALMDDYWYVKNQTGSPIAAGKLVYASGTLGTSGRILVAPYIANGTIDAKYVLGVVAETIPDGGDGYVITKGKLRGINTSAYPDGTVLWASTANAGNLTDTVPQAPNFRLPVAFVVHSASNGILAVRVTTGSDLYEDHRVQVGSPTDGQLLRYNSTNQRWENWSPNFATADTSGRNNYFAISNDTLRIGDDNDTLFVKLPIVGVSAGTGISVSTVNGAATVTNSAPDQTVVLTAGAGITTSGTYPNFTITAVDTSATNELQTLSISNDTLSISGGNSVVLPPAVLKIRDVTVTTDTVKTADLGKLIRCNNAGAITLRIDTNANQPLPIGAVISVEQVGAGVVTITPISGVTINPTARKTWGQYSVIQLIKVGTNTWNVVGGIN